MGIKHVQRKQNNIYLQDSNRKYYRPFVALLAVSGFNVAFWVLTSCGFVNKNNVSGEFVVCILHCSVAFCCLDLGRFIERTTRISDSGFLDAFGRNNNYRKVQNHLTGGKMDYKLF
jgi:hypothetical protein